MLAHHVGLAVDPLAWRGALRQAHMTLNPDSAKMDFFLFAKLRIMAISQFFESNSSRSKLVLRKGAVNDDHPAV
jgi:hypothetical protein